MEEIISHWPTQNQNSVYESSPLLELYLDLWDRNRFFTNVLLKCWIARVTKNLDKLPCTKALPQAPSPVFTAIPPIYTTGLLNYRVRKLLVFWCHYYSLLSFLPFWVYFLHISGSHSFLKTPLSLSETSKTSSRQYKNKSSVSP